MYIVLVCYNCGHYLLAKKFQKTKLCPYCSSRLNLSKTKKVVQAKTAQEASLYIRNLKIKKNR
ncbi:MAG: DUF1922 domain-containing protein [Candidatus Bathyarchaeota archaeon]|nr:MAG: DUF1922 domain-containing protein [Candidatus Bathyarchaeota archaeon]